MKNLFYSKSEKIAFWVSNYGCSSSKVSEVVEWLKEKGGLAANAFGVELDAVRWYEITVSRRYKNMHVFYAETDVVPENAFELGEEWTMEKWLSK